MTSIDRTEWARKKGRGAVGGFASAAILVLSSPVLAQERHDQTPRLEAQASRTVAFDIPAQPLAQALTAFGRQSGLQVAFDPAAVAGKTSVALNGLMATEQALRTLLGGTGLAYQFTSAGAVTISGATSGSGGVYLDPVQVQGYGVPPQAMIDNIPPPYAGGQVATGSQLGLLGNRDVMDTPFNQTSYTAKKAQDQQAKTVRDVLNDDPSVRSSVPDGATPGDNMHIRGFAATSFMTYGGLYGILPTYSPMAEIAERVEVLKGPSAMLTGLPPGDAIGGSINIVPKRAPDDGLTQLTANYLSSGQVGGHIDVARRFGENKEFGVRFNGVFRAGQTDIQWNTDQRGLALLGLDYRGERFRLSADLGYQYQYIGGVLPFLGVASGVPLPWAPNIRNNPGGQPWNSQERKDLFGVVRGEFDITEQVTAYATLGAHDNRVGALRNAVSVIATNFAGNSTVTPNTLSQYQTYLTAEVGVRARAETGPIGHEIAFSATTLDWGSGFAVVNGAPFATNIYNSVAVTQPNIPMGVANKTSNTTLSSLALADTLTAAEKRIQLTVGARLQRVQSANFNATTGAQTDGYDQAALSPSVALVFKPWQNVSLYGNFIQGLQQGSTVPSNFVNAGQVFPPFKSTQYEVGVKVDWGKLTTTMSAFQISRPSLITDVPTNTQVLGGEQRNQGLEFDFFGEPIEGVRVVGGLMLLSAVLTKTAGGTTDGWIAPFAPTLQLNLGGEWDTPFVPGLTLTGRVVYTGAQYFDTTWPRRMLPDWTRFDVGARYAFENPGAKGKLLVARFAVENLLDTNYWAGGTGPTSLFLGMPRTFRLSLTADF
ncbi:MAG: TonB-dependent receptor [Alphaproteobacteria bacterium]|nr:TonB-dependent receptor [Alphaproteobacteria bacterium]